MGSPQQRSPFPPNFKNLKALILNEIRGFQQNDLGYAWDFIDFCENLEYYKHPNDTGTKGLGPVKWNYCGPFNYVMDYMERRRKNNPDQPNLQFYDLDNYNIDRNDSYYDRFHWLINWCGEFNVKLLNVNSNVFGVASILRPARSSPLVSIKNVRYETFLAELSILEKLVVQSTEDSDFEESWRRVRMRNGITDEQLIQMVQWPSLKTLDVKIDSREMGNGNVEMFLDFLFAPAPGKTRENVKELAIRYDLAKVFGIENVPVPKVGDVPGMCPFVTKLTLQGWMGTEEQVTLFWSGLPLLGEVVLEECVKFGDHAFVGEEKGNPIFLKLKHLRKFALRRMDLMDKITDLAFNLVFRHLKVKEFSLTSNEPIKGISAGGIESLLTGNFNKYVEKFPFDGWSLGGVSEEAFKELKLKFRATHMI